MLPIDLVYLVYHGSYLHICENSDSFWFTRYIKC